MSHFHRWWSREGQYMNMNQNLAHTLWASMSQQYLVTINNLEEGRAKLCAEIRQLKQERNAQCNQYVTH